MMKNYRAPSLEKLTGDMRLDENTAKCIRAVWKMSLDVDLYLSREALESIKTQLDNVWLGKAGTKKHDIVYANQRSAIFNWIDSLYDKLILDRFDLSISPNNFKRQIISQLCEGHGVEYLGVANKGGERVYYVNMGDTYAATIIFNGKNAFVSSFGDVVENGFVRGLEYGK